MSKENGAKTSASPKRAVVLYSVALFVVVVVFIAISYLINARGQDRFEALHAQQTTALQKLETLYNDNETLRFELSGKDELIAELEEELILARTALTEETEQLESRHKTELDSLMSKYNELQAELEALQNSLIEDTNTEDLAE